MIMTIFPWEGVLEFPEPSQIPDLQSYITVVIFIINQISCLKSSSLLLPKSQSSGENNMFHEPSQDKLKKENKMKK
jgi:hypothetical protein